MNFLAIISLLIIAAIAYYGEKAVIRRYTEAADFSVRLIGYAILLTLFSSAVYWSVEAVRSMHVGTATKAQIVFLMAYLLGSIPFGFIFTRLAGYGDIRKIGSGNIGATNVLRTGSKELAGLTFIMDAAKGLIAVIAADDISPALGPAAGIAALLGHMYPVWLEFNGGKGVATAIGAITAIYWPVGVAIMVLWVIIASLFRFSSLAAIISIGASPFLGTSLIETGGAQLVAIFIMAFFVLLKHVPNMKRLLKGKEPKIGERSSDAETSAD